MNKPEPLTQKTPAAPTNPYKAKEKRIRRIGKIVSFLIIGLIIYWFRGAWMPLVSPYMPTHTATVTLTQTPTATKTAAPTKTPTVVETKPTESPTPTALFTATTAATLVSPTPISVNSCLSQHVNIDLTFDKVTREFVLRSNKELVRMYDEKIGPICLKGTDIGRKIVRFTAVEHVYEIRLPLAADRTIDGFKIWDDVDVYITSLTNGLMYAELKDAYIDLLISPALFATATPAP